MSKVRSTYAGFVGLDGVPVMLHDGEEYDADHPLVLARPELFTEPARPARSPLRRQAKEAKESGD